MRNLLATIRWWWARRRYTDPKGQPLPCPDCVRRLPHAGLFTMLALGVALPVIDCPGCRAVKIPRRRDYLGDFIGGGK